MIAEAGTFGENCPLENSGFWDTNPPGIPGVTFTPTYAYVTSVSVPQPGIYFFRYTWPTVDRFVEGVYTWFDPPEVDAGPDAAMTAGNPFWLDAAALNYDYVQWTTSGDGDFGNEFDLITSYTPGSQDIIDCNVELCITAYPIEPCTEPVTDCMLLTIESEPVATQPLGDGSEAEPYLINSLENLYWIAVETNAGNDFSGKFFLQTNNIDAAETEYWFCGLGWKPIGDFYSTRFKGSYDGDCHSIESLFIDRPTENFIGLFGAAENAVFSELRLHNFDITANKLVGSLAGYVTNATNISYVDVIDAQIYLSENYGGGLVGQALSSTIYRCSSSGLLTKGGLYTANWIGGLIGSLANAAIVEECYSTTNVTSLQNNIYGGLVGVIWTGGIIKNSYARGSVIGTWAVAGGFVGDFSPGLIKNSYSTGYVFANELFVNGFVGRNQGGTCEANFWDIETSYQTNSDPCAEGLTTVDMKKMVTFTDAYWDFDNIWAIDESENDGYPFLQWQVEPSVDAGGFILSDDCQPVQLNADVKNYLSVKWSGGMGSFSNANIPDPLYFPHSSEYGPIINLCIEAMPIDPCRNSFIDCVDVKILRPDLFAFIPEITAVSYSDQGAFIEILETNYSDYCSLKQLRWYIGTAPGSLSFYQGSVNPKDLFFLPYLYPEVTTLYVKAELDLDCHLCGTETITTNEGIIYLCKPVQLLINNPYLLPPDGYCAPFTPQLSVIIDYQDPNEPECYYTSIKWFHNGEFVVENEVVYQHPLPLEFDPEDDCYTDHVFKVIVTSICGARSAEVTIRVYDPNASEGALVMNPMQDQPLCPGDDATLEYEYVCAGDPPSWKWYFKADASVIEPDPVTYAEIPNQGSNNPRYNTNRLYETTWFMVEKQNGACEPVYLHYRIEVKDEIAITDFTAIPYNCVEDGIDLRLDFEPSPISGTSCTYKIIWFRDGIPISPPIYVSESPAEYGYIPGGSVAGNYYATIQDVCCLNNKAKVSDIVSIKPACYPKLSGPCYRCPEDDSPIELLATIYPLCGCYPGAGNCTFKWFRLNQILDEWEFLPEATEMAYSSSDAGCFRFELTCENGNYICIKTDEICVIECDAPDPCDLYPEHLIMTNLILNEDDHFHALKTIVLTNLVATSGAEIYFTACETITMELGIWFGPAPDGKIHIIPYDASDPHDYFTTFEHCCGEKSEVMLVAETLTAELPVNLRENSFFRVYPNPTVGTFTLEFIDTQEGQESSTLRLEIFNLIGNRVYSAELPAQPSYTLSLAGQQPGMYIIRVMKNNKLGIERIVKQ
jgi:hypothetical protein